MKTTKRQLAVRFVDMLGDRSLADLAPALIQAAFEAGYTNRDVAGLIAAVEHELKVRHGVVEVSITTAHDLPAATLKNIADEMTEAAGATDYNLTHTIDASLLGGFEAQAGGVAIHNSIRSNLVKSGVLHG